MKKMVQRARSGVQSLSIFALAFILGSSADLLGYGVIADPRAYCAHTGGSGLLDAAMSCPT
jgi:hypothetical protein